MLDVILAYAHHLAVFALVGLLFAEFVLLRPGLDATALTRIGRFDNAYGMAAMLVILAGLARVFFGDAGSGYYFANHVFWTKMALIVIVALLSIQPTVAIMRWRKAAKAEPGYVVPESEVKRSRHFLHAELIVLFLVPLAAAAMARGVGL